MLHGCHQLLVYAVLLSQIKGVTCVLFCQREDSTIELLLKPHFKRCNKKYFWKKKRNSKSCLNPYDFYILGLSCNMIKIYRNGVKLEILNKSKNVFCANYLLQFINMKSESTVMTI